MGVHISFVKSSTLDSWNRKLLDKFKAHGGNDEVNSYYESKLPSALKPDEHGETYQLEQFIRQKYIDKKWWSKKKRKKRRPNHPNNRAKNDAKVQAKRKRNPHRV